MKKQVDLDQSQGWTPEGTTHERAVSKPASSKVELRRSKFQELNAGAVAKCETKTRACERDCNKWNRQQMGRCKLTKTTETIVNSKEELRRSTSQSLTGEVAAKRKT